MPYDITWKTPRQVLNLKLIDGVTVEEFGEINAHLLALLHALEHYEHAALLIDVGAARQVPQDFTSLKASQTFADHPALKSIVVVGSNKYLRLMMLLTYGLHRSSLHFVDSFERAQIVLRTLRLTSV